MNWPEDYYRELDGDKRREWLDQRIEEIGASRETDILQELWDARYGGAIDGFIKAWLDLLVQSKKKSFFGVAKKSRGGAKDRERVEKAARMLLLDRFGQMDEEEQRLTRDEYLHLFRMIIYLECTDSGFNHRALGFTKLDSEALQKKIADQLDRALRKLPQDYQMEELFVPLAAAADEAMELSFEAEPIKYS